MSDTHMTDAQIRHLFEQYGIPMVAQWQASGEKEVLLACRNAGFPVVLKGVKKNILHKTESGMVNIGLHTENQVSRAMEQMGATAAPDAYLVQPMVAGKRELVAGMFRDRQFGPVILFGLGGILTEAIKDVVFKVAPLSDADMDDMFDSIASKKLLGEFRGEAAMDTAAMKQALKALSNIAMEHPEIHEIDINPLIIQPDGALVAVDGLVVTGSAAIGPAATCACAQPESAAPGHIDLEALRRCYYPESVAFIGASSTFGKWGQTLLANTLSQKYPGRVYLVNPKGGTIAGRPVYKEVGDIDGPVDLAVITIPAEHVMALIPELEKKQVKGMLVITSGFREVGPEGAELEKKLVAAARKANLVLLGPNTMGISNPHANFHCCGAHIYPPAGSIAMVCQSGNMGAQLMTFAEQQDIGVRAFSGSGNEAMVTIEDYLDVFETDELTRTVVLYLESIKNGPRFFEGARRVSMKKPVVVLKGGRTRKGAQAASSHTGAMASDARVFDAACHQAGIIQAKSTMDLLDLSAVFSSLPQPKGNRVAIMTLGGGWGVVTADLCAEHGLEVPPLSDNIIEELNRILPPYWSHANPVDIVGERDAQIPKKCLELLLAWDGCDAVIHLGIHGKRIMVQRLLESAAAIDPSLDADIRETYTKAIDAEEDEYIRHVARLTETYQKPVLGVSLLTNQDSRTVYRSKDAQSSSIFFPLPERAVKSLWGMVQREKWLKTQQAK